MIIELPVFLLFVLMTFGISVPNIDLIKGDVVHKSLSNFFSEDLPITETNGILWASRKLKNVFMKCWETKRKDISLLNLTEQEIDEHYNDCLEMLNHWLKEFLDKISNVPLPFADAFAKLKPKTEDECYSKEFDVRGYIDYTDNANGEVRIIDYKTSARFETTKEQRMQLAIYAYLYEKQHGIRPDKVGIYFLREKLHLISVDNNMIESFE